jgi:hypothetical protein
MGAGLIAAISVGDELQLDRSLACLETERKDFQQLRGLGPEKNELSGRAC